jgi:DNA-binding transcriptional ArsR family regulator
MAYSDALTALADPTRRAIFEKLQDGPCPVGRLAADLPVSRPAVSQHLRVLERAGLVRAHRAGTRRVYSVEMQGLDELRRYLDDLWTETRRNLAAAAERKGDTT